MQEVLSQILLKLDNIKKDVKVLKDGQERIERKIGVIPEQYQN